jgi:hypothetical protein
LSFTLGGHIPVSAKLTGMRTGISKLAGTIGLAVGVVVIGGSIAGGIALASDHAHDRTPAVADTSAPEGTHGDDADDQDGTNQLSDDEATPGATGEAGDDEATEDETEDEATEHGTTPTPHPTSSHHEDGPGDD